MDKYVYGLQLTSGAEMTVYCKVKTIQELIDKIKNTEWIMFERNTEWVQRAVGTEEDHITETVTIRTNSIVGISA